MPDDDKGKVDTAQAVKYLRENMLAILDLLELQTTLAKYKYDLLIKRGFTSEQAIELTKGTFTL